MKRRSIIIALFCILSMLFISACGSGIAIQIGGNKSADEKTKEEEDEEDEEDVPRTVEKHKKRVKKTSESTEIQTTQVPTALETVPQTQPAETQPEPTQPPATTVQAQVWNTLYVVNCRESITLRTSPSTSAGEIRQIPLGAAVSFMENASNGFYKVAYMGDTGYALASYLSENPYDHYTVPATTVADDSFTGIVVNCKQSITLRKVPSTSGAEILQIPLGSLVTVYGRADNGFYYVYYGGYDGYALASYIDPY